MGLTIAGWSQAGASDVVNLFLAVLKLANRRLDDFVPDPDRVLAIELSSTDVEAELADASSLDSRQLYEILQAEPAMRFGGRSLSQSGEWRWELSKPLRRYRDVAPSRATSRP
jgi:hypothetical protein